MKKHLIKSTVGFMLLFCAGFGFGQSTIDVASQSPITDSGSQVWEFASFTAKLVVPGGQKAVLRVTGQPAPTFYSTGLDNQGEFDLAMYQSQDILPFGTSYTICFTPLASAPQQCLQNVKVINQGSGFYFVTFSPKALQIQSAVLRYAYNATEIINPNQSDSYINTISGCGFLYTNGSWVAMPCGGSSGVTLATGTAPIVITPTTGHIVVSCPTCATGGAIAHTFLILKGDGAGNALVSTGEDVAITAEAPFNSGGATGNVILSTPLAPNPGQNNVVIGAGAGAELNHSPNTVAQSAYENVIIGFNAGQNMTTQNFSVLIGSQAGMSLTGTGTPVEDGINTCIGAGSCQAITTGGDNVAVGEDAMDGALVNSSSNTVLGTHAGDSPTTMNASEIIGHSAMSTTGTCTVLDDVVIGDSVTGSGCSNSENVFIGHQAALHFTTPVQDVVIGSQSAQQMTSENESVIIGFASGNNMTTGQQNVAIGYNAMGSQTAQSNSIGIGAFSNSDLGSDNIEIGGFTGSGSTSNGNVCIGLQACNNMTGGGNTAIGSGTKATSTGTGNNNVLIGRNANIAPNINLAIQLGAGTNITGSSAQIFDTPIMGSTTFTLTGCSAGTFTGHATVGTFVSGTTGTCAVALHPGLTAPHGWVCFASNRTTPANTFLQSADNPTTCVMSGTTVASDIIQFSATAY